MLQSITKRKRKVLSTRILKRRMFIKQPEKLIIQIDEIYREHGTSF